MNGLKYVFENNDFVHINFDGIEYFRYSQVSKLYGITFRQQWNSSRYSDEGFVSLIVDISDTNKPIVIVRAWQYGSKPRID